METLICCREMSLIGSTSFGFAQNTMHDFQNTVLNSKWHSLRQMPQKQQSCRRSSHHKITAILYTGGMDRPTNRLIPVQLQKHSFCGVINVETPTPNVVRTPHYPIFKSTNTL